MPRSAPAPRFETVAELLASLGDVSPWRVRLRPPPGKATERDLIKLNDRKEWLYELINGTLVAKVLSFPESALTMRLAWLLGRFVKVDDLGALAGANGPFRLRPGLVRLPAISFVLWQRFPGHVLPRDPIAALAPDLAVEVLREGNTPGEMTRKLGDHLDNGVPLVWFVDPRQRTVQVFTGLDQSTTLTEKRALDGGDVLPGLSLPVRQIFAERPAHKHTRI
jgi:Uma2 family endonuclease